MLLESMDEHARKERALGGHGRAVPEVHSVQIGDDAGGVGGVGGPVRVRLKHTLYGCIVTSFGEKLKAHGRLAFPLGSVIIQYDTQN